MYVCVENSVQISLCMFLKREEKDNYKEYQHYFVWETITRAYFQDFQPAEL